MGDDIANRPVPVLLSPKGELWATAPDNTWYLRGEPWPAVGELVEICWSSRKIDPTFYKYSKGRLDQPPSANGGSAWVNEYGADLVFNPDFWRPLRNTEN